MRAKQIVEHIENDRLWDAVWSCSVLTSHLEDQDFLRAYGKILVYGDSIMDRYLKDLLDRKPITDPGKFEGETEATKYIWESILSNGTCENDFSHESFGYYALWTRSARDPVEYPAYIIHEADNGFVTATHFDSHEKAYQEWERISGELNSCDT
jgi:hypothetical protein